MIIIANPNSLVAKLKAGYNTVSLYENVPEQKEDDFLTIEECKELLSTNIFEPVNDDSVVYFDYLDANFDAVKLKDCQLIKKIIILKMSQKI